ncbi:hypothetical protein PPERSA_11480 [Pseudocohnilembus persalinus]|uniref:ubiquitinyl hydrolase 1 n=1 Tax=Pseudocohnilembus persalinus TaxID=266149 RepID=A0A0V0QWQ7_PSEPJ|nr:hypothetical protein PPERSA_11480 [Pseudocohnilembus persalinus]|eukprot:KRX06835.1 hypothetical protein PPERSA_11480 [Pseudocohnilembus persalinus]
MWDEQSDDEIESYVLEQSRITNYNLNDSPSQFSQQSFNITQSQHFSPQKKDNEDINSLQSQISQLNKLSCKNLKEPESNNQTTKKQDKQLNEQNSQQDQNIGNLQSLDNFISEFQNFKMKKKLQEIKTIYPNYRQIKGDGNSFFRAFSFAYFTEVLKSQDNKEFQNLLIAIKGTDFSLIQKYPNNVVDISNIEFAKLLKQLRKDKDQLQNAEQLLMQEINQNQKFDFYTVSFIKLQSYKYFQQKEDYYTAFILDETVSQVQNIYLQWGKEAEEIPIETTAVNFKFILNIHEQDQDGYKCQTFNENIINKAISQSSIPKIVDLFFWQEHYIIFSKQNQQIQNQNKIDNISVQEKQIYQDLQVNSQNFYGNKNSFDSQNQQKLEAENLKNDLNYVIEQNNSQQQSQQSKNQLLSSQTLKNLEQQYDKIQINDFMNQGDQSPKDLQFKTQSDIQNQKIEKYIQHQGYSYQQQQENEVQNDEVDENNTSNLKNQLKKLKQSNINKSDKTLLRNYNNFNEGKNKIPLLSQNEIQQLKIQNDKQNLLNKQEDNQNLTNQYDILNNKNQVMKNQVFEKYDEEEKKLPLQQLFQRSQVVGITKLLKLFI